MARRGRRRRSSWSRSPYLAQEIGQHPFREPGDESDDKDVQRRCDQGGCGALSLVTAGERRPAQIYLYYLSIKQRHENDRTNRTNGDPQPGIRDIREALKIR